MGTCKNCGHILVYRNGRYVHQSESDKPEYERPMITEKECWCGCNSPSDWKNPPEYPEAYLLNPETYEKRLKQSRKKSFWSW